MLIGIFRKALFYMRGVQEVGLFALMSSARLFQLFNASPLFFVVLPMLGFLYTIQGILNGYELSKASNKNVDKWSNFFVSLSCSILSGISLYGAVVATALGVTFAAGPWFFFTSVLLAFAHQTTMLCLNAYRAYESWEDKGQRLHYLQALINNMYILGLVTAVIGSVVFVMLTPAAPVIGSICSLIAVAMTGFSMLWQIIPDSWKNPLKAQFFLVRDVEPEQDDCSSSHMLETTPVQRVHLELNSGAVRIFSKCDYAAMISTKDNDAATSYLRQVIERKIALYKNQPVPHQEKNRQKRSLLEHLKTNLNRDIPFSKEEILGEYPLAFQSFWAETGEVEQIVDALVLIQDRKLDGAPQETLLRATMP
jgi:F0F1-type ATP synthase assembly protein I